MKKIILIAALFASTQVFAESPVELPMDPCALIADAECSVGPDGVVTINPYDICDTHGICEAPEKPIIGNAASIINVDQKFIKKQARMENNIAVKYAKLEIYKECVEGAKNLKSLKVCKKTFKGKRQNNKKSKSRK